MANIDKRQLLAQVLELRCLKIKEKVSFNIASEASFGYILSGQKLTKMPKLATFDKFF